MAERRYTQREALTLAVNMSRSMLARELGQQTAFSGSRKYYEALGYPKSISAEDYRLRYNRQDLARRIVDLPAEDTWGKPPKISENGNVETPFVQAWQTLVDRRAVWNRLFRADKLSRIGRFGILVMGVKDGEEPEEPVEAESLSGPEDILYLTPYQEIDVEIAEFEENTQSERYGLPILYEVQVREDKDAVRIHHSRVIHLAEIRTSSEVYGLPPLMAVYNRLDDLIKVVGGSAEATWMNMRKGTLLDVKDDYDPSEIDSEDIEDELARYAHDPLRILWLQGVTAEDIGGSEVMDPRGPFEVIIALVAAVTGIPQRRLVGSARGELASAQEDMRQWAMHVAGRQKTYAEPDILRKFIGRLMELGALPEVEKYHVGEKGKDGEWHWPPITQMTEKEQAEIRNIDAQAVRSMSDPMADYPIEREERREMLGFPAELEGEGMGEREMEGLATHSHKGEEVTHICPLCGAQSAQKYDGHKGLLVCNGCGKTYDPEVE